MRLIEELKALNLPLGQYIVTGSGTLAALGIRNAADIDIAVTPALYAALRESGEWEEEERYGKIFLNAGAFRDHPQTALGRLPGNGRRGDCLGAGH
jgi:hypothetical protein